MALIYFIIIYFVFSYLQIFKIEISQNFSGYNTDVSKLYLRIVIGKTYFDRLFNPLFHWLNFFSFSFYFYIAFAIKLIRDLERYKTIQFNLEKIHLNYELSLFNIQLNPTFVLETLKSIDQTLVKTEPKASEITKKLTSLMDFSLNDSKSDFVPLEKEIKFIEEYISLEKIRHSKKTKITFNKEGDFQGFQIPPLILITFVENAFKHGINKTIQSSWVEIDCKLLENKKLQFNVKNSIPKLNNNVNDKGIGLKNAKKRLGLLFPEKHTLTIKEELACFEINLVLELN